MMNSYLLVAIGGAAGSVVRYTLFRAVPGHGYAFASLSVNITGSFLIGLISTVPLLRGGPWAALLMTGILGGFTTFSTFSLDVLALWTRGHVALAALYVVASLVLSIGAVFIGYAIGRGIFA